MQWLHSRTSQCAPRMKPRLNGIPVVLQGVINEKEGL
jgi:hypothetical protein